MRIAIFLLTVTLTAAAPCFAADSNAAGTDDAGSQADKPTQAELAAAELAAGKRLADTLITPGLVDGLVNGMVQRMVQRQSNLKPYSDTITDFYKRYAGADEMSDFMARVYARNLSVKEMKDINDFYDTPTGHKAMRMIPRTLQLAAQWSRRKVMQHRAELVSAMKQEAAKQQPGASDSAGGDSAGNDAAAAQ